MILQITVGCLIGLAAYFILADIYRIPYMKTSKAVGNLSKMQREETGAVDVWLGNFALFLSKRIKINEFRKQELESDLKTAQMDITPEMYMANAIVKSLLIGVFAVPVIFIMPVACPLIIVLAFVLYKMNMKKVSKKIKVKRMKIENDLPRLVSTIGKKISYDRSITAILYDFAKCSCPELKHELMITIADMNSGNEEAAITRLEARVGSSMMSDVCRGFITLIHGDTAEAYWANIGLKFSDIQRQRLKAEANKIPKKVKKLSMALLVCFLLVYVVVIISQIMNSIGVMFG